MVTNKSFNLSIGLQSVMDTLHRRKLLFFCNIINHWGDASYSRNTVTVREKMRKRKKKERGDRSVVSVCPIDKDYAFPDWALYTL